MDNNIIEEVGKTQIPLSIDANFDSDDIEFKIISDGLGFHNDRKEDFQKELRSSVRHAKPSKQFNNNDTKIQRASLNSFYNFNKKSYKGQHKTQTQDQQTENLNETEAKLLTQLGAWGIDLTIIMLSLLFTLAMFLFVSGIKINLFLSIIPPIEASFFSGILFLLYYIIYFSILDLTRTPGKALLNIKIVKNNNSDICIQNTKN